MRTAPTSGVVRTAFGEILGLFLSGCALLALSLHMLDNFTYLCAEIVLLNAVSVQDRAPMTGVRSQRNGF